MFQDPLCCTIRSARPSFPALESRIDERPLAFSTPPDSKASDNPTDRSRYYASCSPTSEDRVDASVGLVPVGFYAFTGSALSQLDSIVLSRVTLNGRSPSSARILIINKPVLYAQHLLLALLTTLVLVCRVMHCVAFNRSFFTLFYIWSQPKTGFSLMEAVLLSRLEFYVTLCTTL